MVGICFMGDPYYDWQGDSLEFYGELTITNFYHQISFIILSAVFNKRALFSDDFS